MGQEGQEPPPLGSLLDWVLQQLQSQRVLTVPPFPDPETASPEGLLALSRGLTADMVLEAYRQGIFPMAEPDDVVAWWCPDPRTILDLETFHVPRRLARTVRQGRFEVRVDTACPQVIAACADRTETWISPRFQEVYGELHRRGFVHSVEIWRAGELAGGLYGVSLGGAFMAESMFHRQRDASKLAVVALVERLRARGMPLLDIQFQTDATAVFRPRKISRREYLRRLRVALASPARFLDPPPEALDRSGS